MSTPQPHTVDKTLYYKNSSLHKAARFPSYVNKGLARHDTLSDTKRKMHSVLCSTEVKRKEMVTMKLRVLGDCGTRHTAPSLPAGGVSPWSPMRDGMQGPRRLSTGSATQGEARDSSGASTAPHQLHFQGLPLGSWLQVNMCPRLTHEAEPQDSSGRNR